MENLQHIVAIEIGSTKIVGAIAEKSTTGYLSVNHLEEEKLTNLSLIHISEPTRPY